LSDSKPKLPGLTHAEQLVVEEAMERRIGELMLDSMGRGAAVEAGVAEWAVRYAMRAGLLDEPRVIVRRVERKRR